MQPITEPGAMLRAIEDVLLAKVPDCVLVSCDTDSTISEALAPAKVSIAISRAEAGLTSFNRRLPEKVSRVIANDLNKLIEGVYSFSQRDSHPVLYANAGGKCVDVLGAGSDAMGLAERAEYAN